KYKKSVPALLFILTIILSSIVYYAHNLIAFPTRRSSDLTTITNVLANTPINLTKNIEQINEGVSEEAIEPSPERRAELERILKFEPWKVDDIDDISGTH